MTDIQALNTALNVLAIIFGLPAAIVGLIIMHKVNRLLNALTAYIARNDARIERIDTQGGAGNDARVKAILDANKADIERVMEAIRQIKSG